MSLTLRPLQFSTYNPSIKFGEFPNPVHAHPHEEKLNPAQAEEAIMALYTDPLLRMSQINHKIIPLLQICFGDPSSPYYHHQGAQRPAELLEKILTKIKDDPKEERRFLLTVKLLEIIDDGTRDQSRFNIPFKTRREFRDQIVEDIRQMAATHTSPRGMLGELEKSSVVFPADIETALKKRIADS